MLQLYGVFLYNMDGSPIFCENYDLKRELIVFLLIVRAVTLLWSLR